MFREIKASVLSSDSCVSPLPAASGGLRAWGLVIGHLEGHGT